MTDSTDCLPTGLRCGVQTIMDTSGVSKGMAE